MRRYAWGALAVIATMTAVCLARPAYAQDAAAMLQKGIYQEETAGNIDGAIDLYKKIVALDDANRATVAEAQYRLGECYLKKGRKDDAIAAFKAVATQYEGRFPVAAKAKERLASLAPATGAPKVIKTAPEALSNDVSPALDKITVTFNQKMMNGSWSWTGGGDTYPKTTGGPFYDESVTTCTLPVKLEAGKVYVVGINSPSHRHFQTDKHVPAARYLIVFATKGADGKATPIPDDLAAQAREINEAGAAEGAPKVVKTTPEVFADDVSPALDKITVTFNQKMMDRSWSWTGSGDTYPKTIGDPQYDKGRTTCTINVKLEPGKVYMVGVNSPSHHYFQTPAHVPAAPYVILFATKGADGKPTAIPDDFAARAREINQASAQTTSAESAPAIVKTKPEAFATGVPAATAEITVTFDQPMMDRSWSWTGGGDTYPKGSGAIHYDAGRTTCTTPAKLEPGKAYWVGINSPSHKNFVSAKGKPAPWYIIVFTTATADGKTIAIPDDMAARARKINDAAKSASAQ